MATRTITDARGTWIETLDAGGMVISRQMASESDAFATEREAIKAATDAAVAAEATRAQQVQNVLTALEAGTATGAQVQAILAKLIRYVGAHIPRSS